MRPCSIVWLRSMKREYLAMPDDSTQTRRDLKLKLTDERLPIVISCEPSRMCHKPDRFVSFDQNQGYTDEVNIKRFAEALKLLVLPA